MSRDEFTREFAEMLGVVPAGFSADSDLTALSEWDSVSYLSALVLIDEKLSIAIRPDVISNARKFGDILSAVEAALQD
jgi:acyl carrier protein